MAVSLASRQAVHQRARGLCEYCHTDERWQFVRFTLDHIVPKSKGGSDLIDNLALACRNCNERRSNRCDAIDPDSGNVVQIFNPRRAHWSEHFAWAPDKIRIVGRTSIGKATIALVDLNDDLHDGVVLRIRERDLSEGFHPPPDDPIFSS